MTQSPELAGGAGFTFADQVAVRYLSCLLTETVGPGLPGYPVNRVALEQRDAGEPLDDLIVDGTSSQGQIARLSLQVKRALTISAANSNKDFRDIIRDCWATIDKDGFRHDVDRVGAVCGPSAAPKKCRDLQTLAELARGSATPKDFTDRFLDKGSASTDQHNVMAVLSNLTSELGRSSGFEDLYVLLRHFVLVRFDALHEGAVSEPETLALSSLALKGADNSQAQSLLTALQVIARRGAGTARSFDGASIRNQLSPNFRLSVLPSLRSDLEKLDAASRASALSISNAIGSLKLRRETLVTKAAEAVKKFQFVTLRGLPGGGKSVLLRNMAENAMEDGQVLLLKSDRLSGGSWAEFASTLGLKNVDPAPLLAEIGALGTPTLFIDGLDRIDKAQRNIVLDLFKAIERDPALSDWKVVATLRDTGIEPVRTWLPEILIDGKVASIEVDTLSDEDAQALANEYPYLKSLLFGPEPAKSLVRRPFFARILSETRNPTGAPVESETGLLESWWQRGGYDAENVDLALRRRALLQLARLQAVQMDRPVSSGEIETTLVPSMESLRDDGVVQFSKDGHTVQFSHDIFFEWAFAQLLASKNESWVEVIKQAGEPPAIGRAVELFAQMKFVATDNGWQKSLLPLSSPELRSQWRRAWLLAPLSHPDFAKYVSLYDEVVLADNYRILRQVLVWFQAQRTMPNPLVLNGQLGAELDLDTRIQFADLLAWPENRRAWQRFLAYLEGRFEKLPTALYPLILTLYEVWQNAFADFENATSRALIARIANWLTELENRRINRHPRNMGESDRWKELPDDREFEKDLRKLLLRACRVETARVAQYLSSDFDFPGYIRAPRGQFEEVVSFSRLLADKLPAELVDFSLRHLLQELPEDHRKRRLEEERQAAECRAELRKKPEDQLTRMELMSLDSPNLGYMGPDRWDWEGLAIDRDPTMYFPSSPLSQPFAALFEYAPEEALRLIKSMINHAVEAWRQLHKIIRDSGTPIPLNIDFPWGRQSFWGGRREFLWSRGVWAPKPIASALLALDKWAIEQVENGGEANELIQQIVSGTDSIAILGIALNVALVARTVSPTTEALVCAQRLWQADIERCAQEISHKTSSQIGFSKESQRPDAEAVKKLNEHPVREHDIRALATLHVLQADKQSAERVRDAITSFPGDLPFEFEEHRVDPESSAYLADNARTNAAWGNFENYRLLDVQDQPDQKAVVLVNPVAEEPETKARLAEGNQHLTTVGLFQWAEKSFEQIRVDGWVTVAQAVALAKQFDEPALFLSAEDNPRSSMQRGAVAGVAAVAVAFHWEDDADWANEIIERAARTPEASDPLWTAGSIIGWHPCIFAARAFAAKLKLQPDDRSLAESLLQLIAHPLECVSLETTRQALSLFEQSSRLAWAALDLALSLCLWEPREGNSDSRYHDPAASQEERSKKLERAISRLGEEPTHLPVPPPAWIKLTGKQAAKRPWRRNASEASGEWRLNDRWWHLQFAAKILKMVPMEAVLDDPKLGVLFTEHCRTMLNWTIERTAPSWDRDGRETESKSDCFEWIDEFGSVLGNLIFHLQDDAKITDFLTPIVALEDDPCFALLEPLTVTFMCVGLFDSNEVSSAFEPLINDVLTRVLKIRSFDRNSYRAGQLYGFDLPRLAQWLMFVGVERNAPLAARFANGDWSEISLILPTADRFFRAAGWANSVMSNYLTLVERASLHFPPTEFADAMVAVLSDMPDAAATWRGTLNPARIAGRVAFFAEHNSPIPLELGQKLLRILDFLVDQGDRRAAALQLTPAFRDLRAQPDCAAHQ